MGGNTRTALPGQLLQHQKIDSGDDGQWKQKGTFKVEGNARTARIPHLKNGFTYKFQVQCCNVNGESQTSIFSNEVTPEILLPLGWKEAKNATGRIYYFHTKTKQTQWERPKIKETPKIGDCIPSKGNFDLPGCACLLHNIRIVVAFRLLRNVTYILNTLPGYLISSFSLNELQGLQEQFSKYDIDNSNSIDISEFLSLAQNPDFCICIGGEANFKVLHRSTDLLHRVFQSILKQKEQALLLLHEQQDAQHQTHADELPDNSLTYAEYAQGVLDLRNEVEARKGQANPLVSHIKKVDNFLGKRQIKKRKQKNVVTLLSHHDSGYFFSTDQTADCAYQAVATTCYCIINLSYSHCCSLYVGWKWRFDSGIIQSCSHKACPFLQ
jgi:hypothetical protein